MRRRLGRWLKRARLDGLARLGLHGLGRMRRALAGTDRRIVREYFAAEGPRMLHLGSGAHILAGWLNSDLHPGKGVMCLDATRRFPFADGVFDRVYSEHMIEHLVYADGLRMLAECHRVLRPGGRLRVATPDLAFLVDLYRSDKSALQEQYIRWSTDRFIPAATAYADTFVINNFVRHWGHQFIYDEKVLRQALVGAGFGAVQRLALNASDDPALRGLEHEGRVPEGFLRLETMVLEAVKPPPARPATAVPPSR